MDIDKSWRLLKECTDFYRIKEFLSGNSVDVVFNKRSSFLTVGPTSWHVLHNVQILMCIMLLLQPFLFYVFVSLWVSISEVSRKCNELMTLTHISSGTRFYFGWVQFSGMCKINLLYHFPSIWRKTTKIKHFTAMILIRTLMYWHHSWMLL